MQIHRLTCPLQARAFAAFLAFLLNACSTAPLPLLPSAIVIPAKAEAIDFGTAHSLIQNADRPLAAVAQMEKLVQSKQIPPQLLAQFYAMTGDENGTLALMDLGAEPSLAPLPDISRYTQKNAVETIVLAARNRRVVILNESHISQRQRSFATELALALRKAGFTHFGAEAFTPKIAGTMKDGVPKLEIGTYTLDPVFGDLVRQAVAAGYQLFDYEQRTEQEPKTQVDHATEVKIRDESQAQNIKKQLDENPNAKMFIYVGGGHGEKVPTGEKLLMMALQLKNRTGIDPLSIDQNIGMPSSRIELDSPIYRAVSGLAPQKNPAVLVKNTGEFFTRDGYDMAVFHPRLPDNSNRPGWLTMNGYRQSVAIKFPPMPTRTLLRAFIKTEPVEAIAMDQILVAANQTSATLMLPVGEYRILRQTEAGESIDLGQVVVTAPVGTGKWSNNHVLIQTGFRREIKTLFYSASRSSHPERFLIIHSVPLIDAIAY